MSAAMHPAMPTVAALAAGGNQATTQLWIAIPAAVGAAFSFGLTGALQHAAATRVRDRPALRPGLLLDLARQPVWLISLLANALGSLLQLVALDTGPLVLVQPLLVSGLLFGVFIRALMRHAMPPPLIVFGAVVCAGGLSAFLLLAQPSGGKEWLTLSDALPLAGGLAAVLAVCLAVASRHRGEARTLALAAGAGVLYGVTAGVAKLALGLWQTGGVGALLTHWPLYAIAVLGPTGFLLNQNAYQADTVLAPALAVITVTDPLVGIGVGVLWLDEQLQSGPGPIVGQVLALIALVVGVCLVARGAPQATTGWHSNTTNPIGKAEPR